MIHLANNCGNCGSLQTNSTCGVHQVQVSQDLTCNQFNMRESLIPGMDCTSCGRKDDGSCPHPGKAAAGMRCHMWAPNAQA
ncbi:MAG: hypothetical protein KTR13_02525 [Saprospiraceae bacterium]|nr:hypothetical protein [Saprospiraceae bacterium]